MVTVGRYQKTPNRMTKTLFMAILPRIRITVCRFADRIDLCSAVSLMRL